ncbi:SDR family NAD(P)-dependent oxidoreductase [Actinoplanes derwentensis]|uniref:NADP-dependent 3-hydroxy acid dehydrogenase YdfG n=1 Tax=Actinoplanes derwentensis TaxID=113562 RepID=A0A1H1WJ32_9ACTN|nr:SDR family NAD(P)-dependent oxidoreductase [Actinoplanes derwentensis]GID87451.1 short-chain dehydrogenase/reductase [Actinoplanes derwentensis]SDS97044.1 NADP-dependent 3-hydroxy acid dehydrogenase YdfG [Actinoplanes derwentensis]
MSVVLVTGASTGFGRSTVESLAERGHQVFAGFRDVQGRNEKAAQELTAAGVRVVELDVTDQDSADRAIAEVLTRAGRLDVIVNNAGRIFVGPVEAFTAEQVQDQFNVNALGAVRVNRAALPHLRAQGSGALIQIGSIAGRVTVPFSGLYAASKAALAALTEAWHDELAPFGVESVILDAASYPTNIGANATFGQSDPYAASFGAYVAAISTQPVGDPREVVDAVVTLVETPNGERPRRTVVAPVVQFDAVTALNQVAEQTAVTVATAMGVR